MIPMDKTQQPSPYFIRRTAAAAVSTNGNGAGVIDVTAFCSTIEQVHPLKEYWLTLKRHRWLILACTIVVFLGGVLFWLTRVPLYTAEATILIERKAPQILNVQDVRGGQFDSGDYNAEFLKTQYEILKSRALAERVIREEGLLGHPFFG